MNQISSTNLKVIDQATFNSLNPTCQNLVSKAESGDNQSLITVANNFISGQNGFPMNVNIGMNYLNVGVYKKNVQAMELQGQLLLQGQVVPQDIPRAINILNESATITRNAEEKLELARILLSFQSFDIDSKANETVNYFLAKQICKDAASYGHPHGMVEYAKLCMKEKKNGYGEIHRDFNEAGFYFKRAAELGDAEGMANLGYFIQRGFGGIQVDIEEATNWYKSSYERGNMEGCARLGGLIVSKIIDQYDEEYGVNLVKLSCDSNDKIGLNTYGYIYFNGIAGYQKDYSKASYYFKRSADLGCSIALSNIGNAYLYGKGVSKDINKAIKYNQLALEEGFPLSAKYLAEYYNDPESGIPIDKSKSLYYYKLANELGVKNLEKTINTLSNEQSKCCILI